MEQIVEFLTSTIAKRFYWNTLAGVLGLVVVYVSGINWLYAPLVIALANGITKEINTYLSDNQ